MEIDSTPERVAYVAAHGMDPGGAKTFVPEGVTVVFYSRPGTSLSSLVGMRVLEIFPEHGEEEFTGTADGKVRVPNYVLRPFSDLQAAVRIQVAAVETDTPKTAEYPLCFVGGKYLPEDSQLCTDPACRPPRHQCGGIFGLLEEFNHIRISCCRPRPREINSHGHVTHELKGDPDPKALQAARQISNKFVTLIYDENKDAVTDEEEKLKAAQIAFWKLSPKDQARAIGESKLIQTWFEIQCARDQREKEGDWGLYVYYSTMEEPIKKQILQNPTLRKALAECKNLAQTFSDNQKGRERFDDLPTRDQRWITKLSPETEQWTKPRFARKCLSEAGVYTLWEEGFPIGAFAALHRLIQPNSQSFGTIKSYAAKDPVIIEVSAFGKQFLERWQDPATADDERQHMWDAHQENQERKALYELMPTAVDAWRTRHRLRRARAGLPAAPCALTGYLWLLSQPEGAQEIATTHPDWAPLINDALRILTRWADQDTTDEARQTAWAKWPEHERDAITQLAPAAVEAWQIRQHLASGLATLPADPCPLTGYLWLLDQPRAVKNAAVTHPDWMVLIDAATSIFLWWADPNTTDDARQEQQASWPDYEREAFAQLDPYNLSRR